MSENSIQELVRIDLVHREKVGQETYGTSLYPYNGRSAILDAYEEALDLAVYLRQVIEELTIGDQRVPVTHDEASTEPPHFAAARLHAEDECGWFCNHPSRDGVAK